MINALIIFNMSKKLLRHNFIPMQFSWLLSSKILESLFFILILFHNNLPEIITLQNFQYICICLFLLSYLFCNLYYTKFNAIYKNIYSKKVSILLTKIGFFLVIIYIYMLMLYEPGITPLLDYTNNNYYKLFDNVYLRNFGYFLLFALFNFCIFTYYIFTERSFDLVALSFLIHMFYFVLFCFIMLGYINETVIVIFLVNLFANNILLLKNNPYYKGRNST